MDKICHPGPFRMTRPNCKWIDVILIVLFLIFCILGYNVPTMAFPSFGLKIVSWFDASVRLMIPFLDFELKLDNSKV